MIKAKYDPFLGQLRQDDNLVDSSGIVLYDGTYYYRIIPRDNTLCFDRTITETGFSGTQDVDWEQIGGNS